MRRWRRVRFVSSRRRSHPNEPWMQQIARNVTMDGCGILCTRRYLLHDRDTKYSAAFRTIIQSAHIETVRLLARSPNLNAHAERWVRSVKDECLSKIIPWRTLPAAGDEGLYCALSYRAKSPR